MRNRSGCCELCNGKATVFCSPDSAFLCWSCDAKVHQANFLVARHVRELVCSNCKGVTGDRISGLVFQCESAICPSCSPESDSGELDSLSCSSSSSACVSSCSARRKSEKRHWSEATDAEGIFVNWCTRLGLGGSGSRNVVRTACNAMGVCAEKLTVLPFHVSLVASLWFGIRFCGLKSLSTWQGLEKLEDISGVPAKLISAVESKLERLFKATKIKRRQRQYQEGWAES